MDQCIGNNNNRQKTNGRLNDITAIHHNDKILPELFISLYCHLQH